MASGLRVAVLVPVLNRPERVAPLVASIKQDERCDPVFLCSPGDTAQIEAVDVEAEASRCHRVVFAFDAGAGDYARKINAGFRVFQDDYDWLFLGADDLVFHPGWVDACIETWEFFDRGPCVIGTNDLGNQSVMMGRHATHSLVHRDYLECGTVDEPGKILHEGYDHNFVDNEFVETAQARGTFAFCQFSDVEHLHPFWGKGRDDETYRKGRARFHEDRALFARRQRLWR